MMMFASIGAPVTPTPAALLVLLMEVCAAAEPALESEPEEAVVVAAELLMAMDVAIDEPESVAVVSALVMGDEPPLVCAAKELTMDE